MNNGSDNHSVDEGENVLVLGKLLSTRPAIITIYSKLLCLLYIVFFSLLEKYFACVENGNDFS